jgi:transposase-like protein
MVDRLKRSLEQIEPPICPTCHIEMRWTRSALITAEIIEHLFQCPNCHRTNQTTSKVRATAVPPGKLSAPIRWRAA